MTDDTVALQASKNGNGCGIAIVPLEMGDLRGVLEVTVVPKFWEGSRCQQVELPKEGNLARPAPGVPPTPTRAVVPEMGYLVLSGDPDLVEQARQGLTGLKFDKGRDEESDGDEGAREATLFDQVISAPEKKDGRGPDDAARRFLWQLVAPYSDLVKHNRGEHGRFGYFGGEFIAHIPELKPLVAHWLISESELALPRRRPHFRDERAELGAVRGRIVTEGLVRRMARHRAGVECEYTELDNDHPWQRLLRCAIRSAGAAPELLSDNDRWGFVSRAQRLDRLLQDVALVPPKDALAQIGRGRLQRKNRHAQDAVWLARAYLREHFPAGPGDAAEGGKAVAFGLRFSTARLFERLLARALVTVGDQEWETFVPCGVAIRDPQGNPKQPDLAARPKEGHVKVYLDAKYKADPGSLDAMGMSDQYQQYAYAVASGKPVVMVFVREENGVSGSEGTRTACAMVRGTVDCSIRLGMVGVPFPKPGGAQHHNKVLQKTNDILSKYLCALLQRNGSDVKSGHSMA